MASERYIDLQLIKPLSKGSATKGKISIKKLIKEQLDNFEIIYNDKCCDINNGIIDSLYDSGRSNSVSPSIFSLPDNFQTSNILPLTSLPAGVTVSAVGSYDQFVVPAVTSASIITATGVGTAFQFNRFNSAGTMEYILRIKVDALGTTNPIIGFAGSGGNLSTDVDAASFKYGYLVDFNNYALAAGAGPATVLKYELTNPWLVPRPTEQYQDVTVKRGGVSTSNTYINAGDIVRLTWQRDSRFFTDRFVFLNESTGAYLESSINLGFGDTYYARRFNGFLERIGFVLSDGTYTILNFEANHLAKRNIKIMTIGDSMAFGEGALPKESLTYKLNQIWPNNAFTCANPGVNIYNIQRTQMQDVIKLQPKYVAIFNYLAMNSGGFISTNGDYPNYIDAFTKVINGIIGIGSIPILIKPPIWPLNTNTKNRTPLWWDFVDQQKAIFPEILILDLRKYTMTYDLSKFHHGDHDNKIIADELHKLISTHESQI